MQPELERGSYNSWTKSRDTMEGREGREGSLRNFWTLLELQQLHLWGDSLGPLQSVKFGWYFHYSFSLSFSIILPMLDAEHFLLLSQANSKP